MGLRSALPTPVERVRVDHGRAHVLAAEMLLVYGRTRESS
jgi:hypothetical protein